jgi:NADH:ubiquinone oxidoreductase subunit 4 (subunit M)
MPIVFLASRNAGPLFLISLLIISFWSYSVFLVLDIYLFYISFEGVLIPMYF